MFQLHLKSSTYVPRPFFDLDTPCFAPATYANVALLECRSLAEPVLRSIYVLLLGDCEVFPCLLLEARN